MKNVLVIVYVLLSFAGLTPDSVCRIAGPQRNGIITGSLEFLKGEKELEINFDYSNVVIKNMKEKDFLEMKAMERGEKWVKYWNEEVKNTLKVKFIKHFNEKGILYAGFKDNPQAEYVATIYLFQVNEKGSIQSEVVFTKRGASQELARLRLNSRGGKFGTLENLMGEGYKRAGEDLARLIQRELK